MIQTSPRSDADGESGDRAPTTLGDRKQNLPDWLETVHRKTGKGESGSFCTAGDTIPKTLLPHNSAKDPNGDIDQPLPDVDTPQPREHAKCRTRTRATPTKAGPFTTRWKKTHREHFAKVTFHISLLGASILNGSPVLTVHSFLV